MIFEWPFRQNLRSEQALTLCNAICGLVVKVDVGSKLKVPLKFNASLLHDLDIIKILYIQPYFSAYEKKKSLRCS